MDPRLAPCAHPLLRQASPLDDELGLESARVGVVALIDWYDRQESALATDERPNLDRLIAELDSRLGQQLDEILHHPQLQALEASWRGLKSLVDRTDFGENIHLRVLNVTTQELLADFDDAPELSQSVYFRHVYASGYGQFGGEPVAAVIGDYAFTQARRIFACCISWQLSEPWLMLLSLRDVSPVFRSGTLWPTRPDPGSGRFAGRAGLSALAWIT